MNQSTKKSDSKIVMTCLVLVVAVGGFAWWYGQSAVTDQLETESRSRNESVLERPRDEVVTEVEAGKPVAVDLVDDAAVDLANVLVVRVVDEQGGFLPEATLGIRRVEDDERLDDDAVTKDGDRFLARLPVGFDDIVLVAWSPGYGVKREHHVVVERNDVVIELEPTRTLTGRVIDRWGQRIEGARVSWRSRIDFDVQIRGTTESDAAGYFSLDDVATYSIEISCAHPGYVTNYMSVKDVVRRDDVRIVMLRPASMTGTIVDAASTEPLAGVAVELYLARSVSTGSLRRSVGEQIQRIAEVTTDSEGHFGFDGVPSGMLDLPLAEGRAHVGLWIDAPNYAPRWVSFAAAPPTAENKVGSIELYRGGTIRGRVVDVAGRGVSELDMQVRWRREMSTSTSRGYRVGMTGKLPRNDHVARTDAEGRYVLKDIATTAGGVEVEVHSTLRFDLSTKVTVLPGAEVVAADIIAAESLDDRCELLVVDADTGDPIVTAKVGAHWTRKNRYTDTAGRVSISMFASARSRRSHKIFVSRKGYRPRFVVSSEQTTPEAPQVIELKRMVPVSGRVVDRDGRGVADAEVRLFDGRAPIEEARDFAGYWGVPESQFSIVTADRDGRFEAWAPTGGPVHIVARVKGIGVARPKALLASVWPDDSPHTVRFQTNVNGDAARATREIRVMSRRTGRPVDLGRPVFVMLGADRRRGRRVAPGRYLFEDCPPDLLIEVIVPPAHRPMERRKLTLERSVTDVELADRLTLAATVNATNGALPPRLAFAVWDDAIPADRRIASHYPRDPKPVAIASCKEGRVEVFDLPPGTYALGLATEAGSWRHAVVAEQSMSTFEVTANGVPARGNVTLRLNVR